MVSPAWEGYFKGLPIKQFASETNKKGFQLKCDADRSRSSRVMIGHSNPQTYITTLYMD